MATINRRLVIRGIGLAILGSLLILPAFGDSPSVEGNKGNTPTQRVRNLIRERTAYAGSHRRGYDGKPAYLPGEILIKLKPTASDEVKVLMQGKSKPDKRNITSLELLNRKYQMTEILSAFPEIHHLMERKGKTFTELASELKKKFPKRSQRAPKGAKIPDLSRIYHLKVASGVDPFEISQEYAKDPNVEYAEPNYVYNLFEIPNDPDFIKQWALNNEGQTGGSPDADMDLPEAWDTEKGKPEVVIALSDTGVNYQHEDLAENRWVNQRELEGTTGQDDDGNGYADDIYGYDFYMGDGDPMDFNGHGTKNAGIAAGVANNGVGIAGVAPECQVMALKIFSDSGGGTSGTIGLKSIVYAADNGAQVISMSWGGYSYSQALQDAVDYAYSNGCVLVGAAGNDNSANPLYPASYRHVIAVGSTNARDEKSSFSNYGPTIDVAAPGEDIYNCALNGYDSGTGTSFACPHVAGLAGLIFSHRPNFTNEEVVQVIRSAVDPVQGAWLGTGRVNAQKGLQVQSVPLIQIDSPQPQESFYNQKGPVTITGTAGGEGFQQYELFYGKGKMPSEWITISGPVITPVENGTMGTWEIKDLTDDFYIVKLVVTIQDGGQFQEWVECQVNSFETFPVTTNPANQYAPKLSNEGIVWMDYRNSATSSGDIYFYDFINGKERRITDQSWDQYLPAISGSRIVWQESRDGNSDIYFYDLATGEERQITTNPYTQERPRISGDRIVWIDYRNDQDFLTNSDIYLYDLTTGEERQITTDLKNQKYPAISGDRIVWMDYRNGESNSDIYLYDLTTGEERQITTDLNTQAYPAISGDRIVWEDYRNVVSPNNNTDIYLYDLATGEERQITTQPNGQSSPDISGDKIVWDDNRDVYEDIYLYDLKTQRELRITSHPYYQNTPAISENVITWQDYRNGNADIYLAKLAPETPTPVIGEIAEPIGGDNIYRSIEVIGTAAGENFQEYTLEYGKGMTPSQWQTLQEGKTPVNAEVLGEWKTEGIEEGVYTIRLKVVGRQGEIVEDKIVVNVWDEPPVVIQEYSINGVKNGTISAENEFKEVITIKNVWAGKETLTGVAGIFSCSDPRIQIVQARASFKDIRFGEVASNSEMPFILTTTADLKVGERILFELSLSSDQGMTQKTFELEVSTKTQRGWPVTFPGDNILLVRYSPTIADLDQDGRKEIFIIHPNQDFTGSLLWVLRDNGQPVDGYPVTIEGYSCDSGLAVADVNEDGQKEIITTGWKLPNWDRAGLIILSPQGGILADYDGADGEYYLGVSVADLDHDGKNELITPISEIIFEQTPFEGFTACFSYSDGKITNRWKTRMEFNMDDDIRYLYFDYFYSPPSVGDLDGDGNLEVVINAMTSDGGLYMFRHDGTLLWDYTIGGLKKGGNVPLTTQSICADLNGDGRDEVISEFYDTNAYKLGVWSYSDEKKGMVFMEGWPKSYAGHDEFHYLIPDDFMVGNVDEDPEPEVICLAYQPPFEVDKRFYQVYVYDWNGEVVNGFPVELPSIASLDSYAQLGPVADVNGDQQVDMICFWQDPIGMDVISAIDGKGTLLGGDFPISLLGEIQTMSGYYRNIPAVSDLDQDGDIEIISIDTKQNQINVWDLSAEYSPSKVEWGQLGHDERFSGRYTLLTVPNPDEPGPLPIVTKDFPDLQDVAHLRLVPTKIYYPTTTGVRYPLIILSHGASGNRESYAYIGEHLASHGYIVVAPNHVGSDSVRVKQLMARGMTYMEAIEFVALDTSEWQARAQDVTFLMNQASVWDASDPELMGLFDLMHVGVIGHSYGAKTALSAGGSLLNLPSGLTNLGDPRVDAIVPLSPPAIDPSTGLDELGQFTDASFSNVNVPTFGMSGTKDAGFYGGLPEWRKGSYDLMPFGEKYFVVLENANHLDFTTADLPDGTQAETNRIVRAMALVFFNVILKNDTASRTAYLNEAYMDSLTGSAVPDVQWFWSVSITANPTRGIEPLTVAFTPTISGQSIIIVSYLWNFGDGGTSTEQNPTYTYNSAGTYTVRVTVTDDDGATAQSEVTITVTNVNRPPIAQSQNVTTDEDTSIAIQLSASDPDGDPLTYSILTQPTHGVLTGAPPQVTYTPNTDYFGFDTFTFNVNDGSADSNAATVSITINSVNDPPTVFVFTDVTEGPSPLTVQFSAIAEDVDGVITAYSWDFGDGETSTEPEPLHVYTDVGTYVGQVEVMDDQGAKASTSFTITVVDTTPPVISGIEVTNLTSTTATINWTTDEPSTSQVEYGLTTSCYEIKTAVDSALVTTHTVTLTGLSPATLYYYRVLSQDSSDNRATSLEQTVQTSRISGITFAPSVPGEIIVKFKSEVAQKIRHQLRTTQQPWIQMGLSRLGGLNQRYGLKDIRPFLPELESLMKQHGDSFASVTQSIQRQFPDRTRRISQGSSSPDLSGLYILRLSETTDLAAACEEYAAESKAVEYAEPNYLYQLFAVPNDPEFPQQWSLHNVGQSGGTVDADLDAPEAWDKTQGDSSVVIALTDTGINYRHEDLQQNMWINTIEQNGVPGQDDDGNSYVDDIYGYDFYMNDGDPMDGGGHGTGTAGIVGAVANNAKGISGVAPLCRLMALKISSDSGGTTSASLGAQAIAYAITEGAQVISMSWGGYGYSQSLQDMIDFAYTQGSVLVAAAGNDNSSNLLYPAAYRHVVSVAATDHQDQKASFSNYGGTIDLAAPGDNIRICSLSSYTTSSGTSFSCPHVSGVAGLILSHHPDFTNEDVVKVLRAATDPVQGAWLGTGRINADKALMIQQVPRLEITSPVTRTSLSVGKGTVTINGTADGDGFASYELFYGSGLMPTSWVSMGPAVTTPITQGVLGTWQIAGLPVGPYLVRLVVNSVEGFSFQEIAEYWISAFQVDSPVPLKYAITPSLWQDRVVWSYSNYENPTNIYFYDLTTHIQQTIRTGLGNSTPPKIFGDRIIWSEVRAGTCAGYDVYLYDLVTQQESRITNDPAHQINPVIFGNRIVWQDNRNGNYDIYLYDLDTGQEQQITSDPGDQRTPDIWGDRIVWTDYRQGDTNADIYLYDLTTGKEQQVTTNPKSQFIPRIWEGLIVWNDDRNNPSPQIVSNYDIYLYDLSAQQERQITTGSGIEQSPDIWGDRIVWEDRRHGYGEVYFYDLKQSRELLVSPFNPVGYDSVPAIADDWVVWSYQSIDGKQFSLYFAQRVNQSPIVSISAEPTNGTAPLTVSFMAAASDSDGTIANYSWNFGDGGTSTEQNPTYTYNSAGTYTVRVTVTDDDGATAQSEVTITVTNVNRPPIAQSQNVTTDEDTSIAIQLSASDPDGDPLTYSILTQPSHGVLTGVAPQITYVPNTDYFGLDSFTFNANDGITDSNAATVSITINSVNDPPSVTASADVTQGPSPLAVQFTATASDPDGTIVSYSWDFGDGVGTSADEDPSYTYTSAGSYTATVTVSDDQGAKATSQPITLTVAQGNRPPVLVPIGNQTVAENSLLSFSVSATDPDTDPLTYSASGLPVGASFDPQTTTFSWTPTFTQAGVYSGVQFEVSDGSLSAQEIITLTVTNTNQPPIAQSQNITTDEDTPVPITLTATDEDHDPLTYTVVSQQPPTPAHGTLTGTPPNLTYTPDTNFHGTDSFTFKANDGEADSNEAKVEITVSSVNDLPVADAGGDQTLTDNDDDGLESVTLDGSGSIDADGTIESYSWIENNVEIATGVKPVVTLKVGTHTLTLTVTDDQGATGSDTVAITVKPKAVFYGAKHEPPAGRLYHGWGQFSDLWALDQEPAASGDTQDANDYYTALGVSSPAMLSFYVAPESSRRFGFLKNYQEEIAKRPFFIAQVGLWFQGMEEEIARGSSPEIEQELKLLAEGLRDAGRPVLLRVGYEFNSPWALYDPAFYPAAFRRIVEIFRSVRANNVAAVWDATAVGLPSADPIAWYPGDDVVDWWGLNLFFFPSDFTQPETRAFLDLAKQHQKPILVGESTPIFKNPDGTDRGATSFEEAWSWYDTLFALIQERPEIKGLSVIAIDWTRYSGLSGWPDWPNTRLDAWPELASRYLGSILAPSFIHSPEAKLMFPENIPPQVSIEVNKTSGTAPLTVGFRAIATDQDGTVVAYGWDFGDGGTSTERNPTYTYNSAGTYTAKLEVTDDQGATATATTTITVTQPNSPPIVQDQNVTADEDTSIAIQLSASDPDGDPLTYSILTQSSHGVLTGVAPQVTYTPNTDYFGSDSFTFNVNDGSADSNTATVSMTINSVNDPPTVFVFIDVTKGPSPLAVQFTATASDPDGTIVSYSWDFGDGVGTSADEGPSYTYTSAGSYTATVTVSDDQGAKATSQPITLTVAQGNRPPVLVPIGNQTVAENSLLSFSVSATDPDTDPLTYSASGLPVGASFNPQTATFSWTPTFTQAGVYSGVQFGVSDGSLSAQEIITLTVTNVNRPPMLAPIGAKEVQEGTLLEFSVTGEDPDGGDLDLKAESLPSGADFTITRDDPGKIEGKFSWTPDDTQVGEYSVMFTLSDGEMSDSEAITIKVVEESDRVFLGGAGLVGEDFDKVQVDSVTEKRSDGTTKETPVEKQRMKPPLKTPKIPEFPEPKEISQEEGKQYNVAPQEVFSGPTQGEEPLGLSLTDEGPSTDREGVIPSVPAAEPALQLDAVKETKPPALSILQPTPGATLSGNVRMEIQFQKRPTCLFLYVDGRLRGWKLFFPHRIHWNTQRESNGGHTVTVNAFYLTRFQWIQADSISVQVANLQ